MNKLYKIKVLHAGPKDSHESIECYLVAKDDAKVAKWIQKEKCHDHWYDPYEGDEIEMRYAEDGEAEITFKEWVMLNKGDLGDDEGWDDAFYGITKWGWEDLGEITDEEIKVLGKFGVLAK